MVEHEEFKRRKDDDNTLAAVAVAAKQIKATLLSLNPNPYMGTSLNEGPQYSTAPLQKSSTLLLCLFKCPSPAGFQNQNQPRF